MADVTIDSLSPEAATAHLPALCALLEDAVDGGASVGFLPPLGAGEAAAYWRSVVDALRDGSRRLLVAELPERGLVGAVQLDLVMRPNARHRAEVAKLLVHRAVRRRGIGRALMLAVEEEARRLGRTTLVLDTRQGDPSERLYQSLGYQRAGVIPAYARGADGRLDGTVIYYRLLPS